MTETQIKIPPPRPPHLPDQQETFNKLAAEEPKIPDIRTEGTEVIIKSIGRGDDEKSASLQANKRILKAQKDFIK